MRQQIGNALLLTGDCLEALRSLPECFRVNCCVTSPPYYGLRDYGHDGQIGLEPTPDEYVARLVEVFREVRRVLADDGTLWLNLGDSYASFRDGKCVEQTVSGGQRAMPTAGARNRSASTFVGTGIKHKDLMGIPWRVAFALQQPYYNWQIKSEAMRAWVGGIIDGEGCVTILKTKSSHSDSLSFPPIIQVRMCDIEPLDRLVQVVGSSYGKPQNPLSQVAAKQRPSWQWKVVSEQAANVIAEVYPFLTCKRKQAIVAWNHQAFRSARGNQARQRGDIEKEQFCKTLINQLNQREAVDIPSWMVEPTITQEPGFYLRQDLIWHKPNPMPESVKDRCTKAHEYLFLLTKSARYWYDAGAIAERGVQRETYFGSDRYSAGSGRNDGGSYNATECETRNRRSVWTVATQPYAGAHFATFPPALIEPCILAGCPAGGTVLDPFSGSGTTGQVALQQGRKYLGIELNPEYQALAVERITPHAAQERLFA